MNQIKLDEVIREDRKEQFNLTQAPLMRFSILSLEISIPNTKDKLAAIHFGKSPPFPHA